MALVVQILDQLKAFGDKVPPLLQVFRDNLLLSVPSIVLGTVALILLIRRSTRRSRLLRPEAFDLDPDNPNDLKGRAGNVRALLAKCVEAPFVELTGESGAGKTALVRSGLIPALQEDGRMFPVYVDTYGQDWVSGPRDHLVVALNSALDSKHRQELGLSGTVDGSNWLKVMTNFWGKTGRCPLIIFDQFDDYQVTHRDEFRDSAGFRIKPRDVRDRNSFWEDIAGLVSGSLDTDADEEEGVGGNTASAVGRSSPISRPPGGVRAHCLFVARKDEAASLSCIRFREEDSYDLDLPDAPMLGPLLADLTPPDAAPPVVADPEEGWEQVKRLLERDLARDGMILPVQVLAVLRGLRFLPHRFLTERNYRRAGGVAGLEALYVEQAIKKTGQIFALTGPKIRSMLLDMVSGTKTEPKPLSVLAERAGATPEVARRVLTKLQEFGLVRPRGGAGVFSATVSDGSTDTDTWSLYHDYLSRAVQAADRTANRWALMLRDCYRNHDSASSTLSRWRGLLTPAQQLSLGWARIRRRFRYGEYTGFAAKSLLRFGPWLVSVAAVLAGAVYVENQRLVLLASNEAEQLMRACSLNEIEPPTGLDILWDLALADTRTKRHFWQKALASPLDAENLAGSFDEFKFELVYHAVAGLDVGLTLCSRLKGDLERFFAESERDARSVSLAASLAAKAAECGYEAASLFNLVWGWRATELDDTVRGHLADAAAAVAPRLDEIQARSAFDHVLMAFEAKEDRRSLTDVMIALAARLNEPQAHMAFDQLLRMMAKEEDPWIGRGLADTLGALAPRVSEDYASTAFHDLRQMMAKTGKVDSYRLAGALTALASKLSETEAESALHGLLELMQGNMDRSITMRLGDTLETMVAKLKENQALDAFAKLLEATTRQAGDDWLLGHMAPALATIGAKLNEREASAAFQSLVTAMESFTSADTVFNVWMAGPLGTLIVRLNEEQIPAASTRLLVAIQKNENPFVKASLATELIVRAGKLDEQQAGVVFDDLLVAMGKDSRVAVKIDVALALGQVPGRLTQERAQIALEDLAGELQTTEDPVIKGRLLVARAAVAGKLDVMHIHAAVEKILAMVDQNDDPEVKGKLVEALVASRLELDQRQAQRAFGSLFASMRNAVDTDVKVELAEILADMPGATPHHRQALVDVLKEPDCVDEWREQVLILLEKGSGEDFEGQLRKAVGWAEEQGLNIWSPPVRPQTVEMESADLMGG